MTRAASRSKRTRGSTLHGGEASKLKERFAALSATDRNALLAFVMSR